MVRLFAIYAVISFVPVLVLGLVLASSYRHEAQRRGLDEGRSEAKLIAQTAVESRLDGRPLAGDITHTDEGTRLQRLLAAVGPNNSILRLRLRDLQGHVVFADEPKGFAAQPEDEVLDAAHGEVVAVLTHLNADAGDEGPTGVPAVEVYRPLYVDGHRVGVLEIYLPYGPIQASIDKGLHKLYGELALGLALLYVALFVITASVSRRLRRQLALNAFLAEHDMLTDLPNRTLFHRRVKEALRDGRPTAIAIVDLDRFKEINDTLGHQNGDVLLGELARRLAENTRPEDTVARLGGDEFGVVLRGVTDAPEALARVRALIDQEVDVSGLPVSVEASIGYAVAPEDGTDVDELVQRADVAMYVAKAQHAGVVRYDAHQDHYDAANLALVAELRHAIKDDQLLLHYQPKTRLADGRVEAVEALVRWQHPSQGLLHPDRFLPLAEQTDLIDKLTDWVLDRALTEIRDLGPRAADLAIAVNVSARNLAQPDFARRVVGALERAGVPAGRLIIEITETALLIDPRRAAGVLAELATSGVRVSLDDFGQGQTSLGYLSALPLHELKIDKSFVSDMVVNTAHAAIVRSVVELGHNLSLRVVAEGVETDDVLETLREAGCDVAQGYLLARPVPGDKLNRWLGARATDRRPRPGGKRRPRPISRRSARTS
jgi:diguanylate cyclase (GGDEF)-like protein